jgi:hypothetical protein
LDLLAGHWWPTPVIAALRRQRSGGSQFEFSQGKQSVRLYLKEILYKKGLVEWLKV